MFEAAEKLWNNKGGLPTGEGVGEAGMGVGGGGERMVSRPGRAGQVEYSYLAEKQIPGGVGVGRVGFPPWKFTIPKVTLQKGIFNIQRLPKKISKKLLKKLLQKLLGPSSQTTVFFRAQVTS